MQHPVPATIGVALPLPKNLITIRRKTMLTAGLLLLTLYYSFGQQKTFIKTIYFEYDNYVLDNEEKSKIDSLISDYKIESINISGHCDNNGNNQYNDNLSRKRVTAVKKYLSSKQIDDSLIHVGAFGKRRPLNNNRNEDEMSMNRRVEMEITGKFNKLTDISIQGRVFDDKNQPLIAEVTLNDESGNGIQTVHSDMNGFYAIATKVICNQQYLLNFYNEKNFMSSQPIIFTEKNRVFRNLTSVLPELKAGKKYRFKNMNFYGGEAIMLPSSRPSLEALLNLMLRNKNLVIRIEGHVNHPSYISDENADSALAYNQWLSDERSKKVYEYLLKNGIEEKRLSKIGYGAKYMLYPNAVSDAEQEQNRRVEINVISF